MGDMHGGLLKCVLQLAACSDKLRTTDALLGSMVAAVQRDLPVAELPVLKATLAVVPVSVRADDAHAKQQQFDAALATGTEAAERLEMTKTRLEKELRRRSDNEIAVEKRKQRATSKRRRVHKTRPSERRKKRREEAASEQRVLLHELEEHTREVRATQREFAQLEQQLAREAGDAREAVERQSAQDRQAAAEQRLASELAELRQEIALLQETRQAIADAQQTSSLKAQYDEEIAGIEEEIAHVTSVRDETAAQLSSNGVRLHSLLRTLAPSASIGTLMTRLHQQLTQDAATSPSTVAAATAGKAMRKTVELQAFLSSCPSAEEGQRAIDELKKLQLIYCYESSGILALAD
ncbi:hypothetical protein PybrP1_010878 [[Pythium] brassicae (nom. inval.)]|nr:hypothetical protein PybrP1_010878 [[Pythium] brassicae (nom. inval.)]